MSFDQAILHHKTHRRPYQGAKAIDATCRNHGTCPWCQANRQYQLLRARQAQLARLKEWWQAGGREKVC